MTIAEPHEGQFALLPASSGGAVNRFPHWQATLIDMGEHRQGRPGKPSPERALSYQQKSERQSINQTDSVVGHHGSRLSGNGEIATRLPVAKLSRAASTMESALWASSKSFTLRTRLVTAR